LAVLLRCLFICLVFVQGAQAAPANFHLSDDSAGPTCANFSNMGFLPWQKRGGDWIDSAGQMHGDQAFDVQDVPLGQGRPFTE